MVFLYTAKSCGKSGHERVNIEKIIMGDELFDGEINYAQRLLKTKHPKVGGLRLTLYNGKFQDIENNVQIVHCPSTTG